MLLFCACLVYRSPSLASTQKTCFVRGREREDKPGKKGSGEKNFSKGKCEADSMNRDGKQKIVNPTQRRRRDTKTSSFRRVSNAVFHPPSVRNVSHACAYHSFVDESILTPKRRESARYTKLRF